MSRELFLIEEVSPEVVILPVKCGERPIRGIAGKVDWISGGILLKLLKEGKVQEKEGEKMLYYNPRKFKFPFVFIFYSDIRSLEHNIKNIITEFSANKVFIDLSEVSVPRLTMDSVEIFAYSPHSL